MGPTSEKVEMVFMSSLAIVETVCGWRGRPQVGKEGRGGVRRMGETANGVLKSSWCAFKM